MLGISGVDYDQDELERFRALAGERVLLTPNHPTNTDPALVFHLSAQVNQSFRYLACREAFDACLGLWGHVIKRIGAHSVIRGTADRASFRATRELLASPASKLVIFPEGEVYSQNDTLLPFHDGVFQLAFWALEDARKAVNMFHQVRTEILGVVENMSGGVFGTGGGKLTAESMRIPFLGELPLDAKIRIGGDSGMPVAWEPGSPFDALAERVVAQVKALKPSKLSITVED